MDITKLSTLTINLDNAGLFEKELTEKLVKIGYGDDVVDWVLSELKKIKLIDDKRFAVSFARTKMISKPMGEFLLRRELGTKGIPDEFINLAINEAYKEKDQFAIAFEIAAKQIKKYQKLENTKLKKRISDFLLRRGFSWDVIKDVVESLNEEE